VVVDPHSTPHFSTANRLTGSAIRAEPARPGLSWRCSGTHPFLDTLIAARSAIRARDPAGVSGIGRAPLEVGPHTRLGQLVQPFVIFRLSSMPNEAIDEIADGPKMDTCRTRTSRGSKAPNAFSFSS
jgi:hypothetical protein